MLAAAAVSLVGALNALAASSTGPLDDHDPAHQRPGFLDAVGPRAPAPRVGPGFPAPGEVSVVFFVRAEQREPLLQRLRLDEELRAAAAFAVVTAGPCGADAAALRGVLQRCDPTARVARGYAMPMPRVDGPPVGYALVGPDGDIRYRTLDPALHLDDVAVMVAAI